MSCSRERRHLAAILTGAALFCSPLCAGDIDVQAITGPESCGECHRPEVRVWKATDHARSGRTMHRSEEGRTIAEALGITAIKDDPTCVRCHYTQMQAGPRVRTVAGVSCELCHGEARDWLDIHGDFGGRDVTRETESLRHRKNRIRASEAAGLVRPARLYRLASQCYKCHVVADERLVNEAGHPGGKGFELVSWLHGEMRHNFLDSGGKTNREDPPERKRVMWIVGQGLELEHALRAVASATKKAAYGVEMARRARAALKALEKARKDLELPQLSAIIEAGRKGRLKLNNSKELLAAANAVGAATQAFAESVDGRQLGSLDRLIPGPDDYEGTPAR